jgi:DNA-binding FadR family transcriptional regulator
MLRQATFTRVACARRTRDDLRALRASVDQACARPAGEPWERKAAAHAQFHCLLADVTGASEFALLARFTSDSLQDMIAAAWVSAEDLIIASRRRLLSHLEARDADAAAQEMKDHMATLCRAGGQPGKGSASVRPGRGTGP